MPAKLILPSKPRVGQRVNPSHPLSQNLSGFWLMTLNDTISRVIDSGPLGYHGVYLGRTRKPSEQVEENGNSPYGSLANFDGSDVIDLGTKSQAISIVDEKISGIVLYKATVAGGHSGTLISKRDGTPTEFQFYINNGDISFRREGTFKSNNTNLSEGVWHFIGFSYDGSCAVYLDGIRQGTLTGFPIGSPRAINVSIGSRWNGYPTTAFQHRGSMALAALWPGRVLTDKDHRNLYTNPYEVFYQPLDFIPFLAVQDDQITKTVTGSLQPTGVLTLQAIRDLTASIALGGAPVNEPQITIEGTITSGPGASILQPDKVLAGSITPGPGLLTPLAQLVKSGSIQPTPGTLTRDVFIANEGSITATGDPTHEVRTAFAGSMTPTGIAIKEPQIQPFTATVTPGPGDLTREAQLVLGGSVTPGPGSVTSLDVFKVLAGSITPSATVTKDIFVTVEGSIAPTATIINVLAVSFAGSITPAGALAKEPGLVLAGSVIPAPGVVTRQPKKITSGSIPPGPGTLTLEPQIVLGGSITSSGVIAIEAQAVLAGSVTAAAALTRDVFATVEGTITPSGDLIAEPQILLAGSITPTGVSTSIRVRVLTITGTITTSGILTKQAQVILSGILTPNGAVIFQAKKILAGSVSTLGVLEFLVSTSIAGSIATAGAIAKEVQKLFAGSITPSPGALTRQSQLILLGTITPTGVIVLKPLIILTGSITGSATLVTEITLKTQTVTGSITPTGEVIKQPQIRIVASSGPTGTAVLLIEIIHKGTITPAATLTALPFIGGISGPVTVTLGETLVDTATILAETTLETAKLLDETLPCTATLSETLIS